VIDSDGRGTARATLPRRAVLAGIASGLAFAVAACRGSKASPFSSADKTPASTRSASPAATTPRSGAGSAASPAAAPAQYFPPASGEWARVEPAAAGWSAAKLSALVQMVKDANTWTLVMLAGGRILVEEYFSGDATTVHDIASAQKSITSTLIGVARDRGLLGVDDAVTKFLGHGWSRATAAEEDAITIRHLMTHSSGLSPRTLRKVAEPGTVFDYNTYAYQKLRPLLERAAGSDINSISRSWVYDPIGISTASTWRVRPGEPDPTGVPQWGMVMTARDMVRFGLVAQRGGIWAGNQVVPRGWFDEAWTPCSVKTDYGLLWWLMGRGRLGSQGAPRDWVAALGAQDQKIYVIPSLDVVLARQGLSAKEESEHVSDFDALLIRGVVSARA
jgi:CubicO group peptidase (beta-lactamase class C family)